ncbi:class I adenylate cyclase [Endothiovibrio diazotrophicus]
MDPASVKRRFLLLNEARLARVREELGTTREGLVDLLPLLFHQNDPFLPGFLQESDAEPAAGFPDFQPGRVATEAAKRLVKAAGGPEYRPGARRSYDLHAAFVVGNYGLLARADTPRFDLWLIAADGLDSGPRDALLEKSRAVVTWYEEQEIELTVRLIDPAALRAGRRGHSAGQRQGRRWPRLDLDTLYTQGLWLGGRKPLWWFLPPDYSGDAGQRIAELSAEDPLAEHELVDLGPVQPITAEELFGAATEWMFSGIDRPYRMLPRILLAEAYAEAAAGFRLLSERLKEAVYRGETAVSRLDPLILTYHLAARHLSGEERGDRLDALRRALYIQSGVRLSGKGRAANNGQEGDEDWRRELILELSGRWDWEAARFTDLDERDEWRLERVVDERQFLVGVLSQCFRALSAFGRTQGEGVKEALARFGLLRQKLYAAFERKGGKVELLNFDPDAQIAESHLLFNQPVGADTHGVNPFAAAPALANLNSNATTSGYTLHRGDIKHLDPAPLKRAAGFIELLAWVHFNRLYNPRTLFALNPPEGLVEQRELRSLIEGFQELAPNGKLPDADAEAFSRPATVERAALFINTGRIDPLTRRTRKGIHLSSDAIDVFSYGSRNETLAETFDLVVATNRREVLTFRYQGDEALAECLRDYLSWFPEGSPKPPQIRVHCYSSERGPLFARRFEELFQHLSDALYDAPEPRYIFRFQRTFHLLRFIDGRAQYQSADNYEGVLALLAAPAARFSRTTGNPWALIGTPLPHLLKLNREGTVQFFFHALGAQADVYLLDERGSLFHQLMAFDNDQALLSHFHRFFEAVLPRRGIDGGNELVEYYRITKGKEGRYGLSPEAVDNGGGRRYFQVQVIAEALEDKRSQLTIYCNDEEFSSLEHGDRLFNVVAANILSRRKSGERYPIYITDIDITRLLGRATGDGGVQTIHFLTYKKRIEDRLNEALRNL